MDATRLLKTIGEVATGLLLLFAFVFFAWGLVWQLLCIFGLKATMFATVVGTIAEFCGYCAGFLFIGLMISLYFYRFFMFVLKTIRSRKRDRELFSKELRKEFRGR